MSHIDFEKAMIKEKYGLESLNIDGCVFVPFYQTVDKLNTSVEPSKMTREQFFTIALEILNSEKFGHLGSLFMHSDDLETFHIGQWLDPENVSPEARMPLYEFLDKLYIKLGGGNEG